MNKAKAKRNFFQKHSVESDVFVVSVKLKKHMLANSSREMREMSLLCIRYQFISVWKAFRLISNYERRIDCDTDGPVSV